MDEALKDYIFTEVNTRRRPDSDPLNDDNIIWFYSQKEVKKLSNVKYKVKHIFPPISLSEVGFYLGDCPFTTDAGMVTLHPTNETDCVANINENYFVSHGCSPPRKLSRFILKRNRHFQYSEHKIQGLDCFCTAFCLYIIYLRKIIGIDFKSAILKMYYQAVS